MKVIYIAAPYRADTPWQVENNVRRAETLGLVVAALDNLAVPLIPHSMYRYFNGEQTDEYWLKATMELLSRADAVLFEANWEKSKGACIEHEEAGRLELPRFYVEQGLGKLRAWLGLAEDGHKKEVDVKPNRIGRGLMYGC
jgi:hypothetical protein